MNISGTGNVGVLPLAILTAGGGGGGGGVGLTVFSYKKTYGRFSGTKRLAILT